MGWKKKAKPYGLSLVYPEDFPRYSRAGAVPLYLDNSGIPHLICIEEDGRNGLQVMKGCREEKDRSLLETGLREAREEAGITRSLRSFQGWNKRGILVPDDRREFPIFLGHLNKGYNGGTFSGVHYDENDRTEYVVHGIRIIGSKIPEIVDRFQPRYKKPLEFIMTEVATPKSR